MTDTPTSTDEVRISDLGRAAYLVTRGCRLLRAELAEDRKRVYLVFSDAERVKKNLDELITDPPVGAKEFLGNVSSLKQVINEARIGGVR